MRWSRILGIAGGAVAGSVTGCGYCKNSPWFEVPGAWAQGAGRLEIPVDAAPWLLRPCRHRDAPDDCALVVGGVAIPVEATIEGACDLSLDQLLEYPPGEYVIQTLRPSQPLPAGADVVLDCDHPETSEYDSEYRYSDYGQTALPLTLKIRASGAPAAPPGPLTMLELQYTRDDPNLSCTDGDYIEARVDFDAPFLREGGYIMVTYPDGQVYPFFAPDDDGVVVLPASRGTLKFTPVAINGERGETVEVDASAIADELVYIPGCTQSDSPGALALLVPLREHRARASRARSRGALRPSGGQARVARPLAAW